MDAHPLNMEFEKYWVQLSVAEKESLVIVAKQYVHLKSSKGNDKLYDEIEETASTVEEGKIITESKVQPEWWMDESFINELDNRYNNYTSEKEKAFSIQEIASSIDEIRNNRN